MIEIRILDRLVIADRQNTGVIDQYINRARRLFCRCGHFLPVLLTRHIMGDEFCALAKLPNRRFARSPVDICHDDESAFLDKAAGCRQSDAGRRPCDNGSLVFEPIHALPLFMYDGRLTELMQALLSPQL